MGEQLLEIEKITKNSSSTESIAIMNQTAINKANVTGINKTWSHTDNRGGGTNKSKYKSRTNGPGPHGRSANAGESEGEQTNWSEADMNGGGTMEQQSDGVTTTGGITHK